MSGWGTRLAAATLAGGATLALAALSRVPLPAPETPEALIRLSWRVLGERVEECTRLTPEELERLPAHMRREEVCEGRVSPYRLEVRLDGRAVRSEVVRASGAREDRPIYVFEELRVPPGAHEVDVRFTREPVPGARPDSLRAARRPEAAPDSLAFRAELALESGEIALVTYDRERRELVRAPRR